MVYSFVIRRATIDDAPDVHNILQVAFQEYAKKAGLKNIEALKETIEDIKKEIKEKIVYIAVIDNQIIGTVRIDMDKDCNNAYISRFAVSPNHRNIGIGKALMNLVDKYLLSENISKVILHTASKYSDLMKFYYSRGFYVEAINNDRGYLRAKLVKDYL